MGKDPISEFIKGIIVYQYNCFCKDSYVGMTWRQFGKIIKESILKSTVTFVQWVIKKINLKE